HIGLTESADDMYGKLMSLSDDLAKRYDGLLCTTAGVGRWEAVERDRLHPMDAKKALAGDIVTRFHGAEAASAAAHVFEMRHQKRTPHAPPVVTIKENASEMWICRLIREVGFASSTSEARRLVAQGAVRVDGERVGVDFQFRSGINSLLEVGRKK